MQTLQFKGTTAVECHRHTVPHHTLEFDQNLSVLGKGEKTGLDGNLIIARKSGYTATIWPISSIKAGALYG